MKVMAIVGAGPGLGLSLARRFGREDHRVALLARNRARLEQHVAALGGEGVDAAAHPADVLDRPGSRTRWPAWSRVRRGRRARVQPDTARSRAALAGGDDGRRCAAPVRLLVARWNRSRAGSAPRHARPRRRCPPVHRWVLRPAPGALARERRTRARCATELRVRAQPEPRRPRRLRGNGDGGGTDPPQRHRRRGPRRSAGATGGDGAAAHRPRRHRGHVLGDGDPSATGSRRSSATPRSWRSRCRGDPSMCPPVAERLAVWHTDTTKGAAPWIPRRPVSRST